MAAPLSDEQRELVVSMARTGQGRNAIARTLGLGGGTVSKIIREAGLGFDREATAVATKTRQIEIAEKRSKLELDFLDDAARLRRQLWEPYQYQQPVGGQEPTIMRWTTDRPVPADQLKIVQASTMAVQASQKIADAASDQGTEAAKSMLAQIMTGLGEAFRDLQAADLTQPSQENP